jgi:hypothetical protein
VDECQPLGGGGGGGSGKSRSKSRAKGTKHGRGPRFDPSMMMRPDAPEPSAPTGPPPGDQLQEEGFKAGTRHLPIHNIFSLYRSSSPKALRMVSLTNLATFLNNVSVRPGGMI